MRGILFFEVLTQGHQLILLTTAPKILRLSGDTSTPRTYSACATKQTPTTTSLAVEVPWLPSASRIDTKGGLRGMIVVGAVLNKKTQRSAPRTFSLPCIRARNLGKVTATDFVRSKNSFSIRAI